MHKHSSTTVTQLVEEILWSGGSPHMLVHPVYPPRLSQSLIAACGQAEADPALLDILTEDASTLDLRSHFLGTRFEQAYQVASRSIARHFVQQANRQIVADGRTLGEFDLILGQATACVHQELAVKFYLGLPAESGDHIWFGPGQRDRLDLKLQTLLQRQLVLSEQPAARSTLQKLGLAIQRVELVMKGYLFYPLLAETVTKAPSTLVTATMQGVAGMLTADHLRGYWLTRSQLGELADHGDAWKLLPKSSWLSTASDRDDPALDFSACCEAVERHFIAEEAEQQDASHLRKGARARPVMICNLERSLQGLVERDRYFITSDDWAVHAIRHLAR